MDRNAVIQRAWQELEPELKAQGYDLVEVEYGKHGRSALFRVFIDCDRGVTLDDCTAVSRFLSTFLDVADFIEGRYVLEVSSPGIDRPVRKPEDFRRFIGERVRIKTVAPVAGRKQFTGILKDYREGLVELDCDGTTYPICLGNLHRANLDR